MDREKIFLSIQNFKCLENIREMELKPITLLFGPNGSGKSSLFQAIKFLSHNLFSIYIESREGGPDSEKLYYKPDELTNLISYDQIVTNNDRSREISYLIQFKNAEIKYDGIRNILDQLEDRMITSDEVAKYLVTDEQLKKIKDWNDEKDRILEFSVDSKEEAIRHIFDFENEIIDFNVSVEFSVFGESDKPSISIRITEESENISFFYSPNSLVEENYFSYYKKISGGNKLKSEVLNKILEFTNTIPFVDGIEDSFQEVELSRQKALNEFYDHVNSNIKADQDLVYWQNLNALDKKEFIKSLFRFYIKTFFLLPQKVKEYFYRYLHLPSVREKPKQIYLKYEGRFKSEDYYGLMREFDPTDNQGGFYIKIKYDETMGWFTEIDNIVGIPVASIPKFINYFLKKMQLSDSIQIEQNKYSGFLTFKAFNGDAIINLAQASSGLLQVLPIISISFHSRGKDLAYKKLLRMIEQPELHLHPKLQCDLAEFFCHKVLTERNFIIETHSEHFVRKIQVLIAKANKELGHDDLKDRVAIYYFKNGTVKETELEDNGFFKEPWPDGFFDDSYNLARELIYARKN